jgi:mannose-1-phosphate guanylyltransferase
MEIREAYVLAGGKGERLLPLTQDTPKPLLPVKGKPILEWNIERLKHFGVERFVLGIGHLGGRIKEYFGDGKGLGVKIVYAEEESALGTGGAVRHALGLLGSDFFMINGDNLMDIDYRKMAGIYAAEKADAAIALYEVDDTGSFGVASLEGSKIREFIEKPPAEKASGRLINAGAYVLSKKAVSLLPDGFCLIEKALFPELASKGTLCGYEHKGQWFPTDTVERYEKAEAEWRGF